MAGAGYGKTTLLASWSEELRCAWHTIRGEDAKLPVLAQRIGDALRTAVPELVEDPLQAAVGSEVASADAFAAYLCEKLEQHARHDVVLVLDDLHQLGDPPASRLVEALCLHAPPTLHLVLASRAEPPFRTARLRGRGDLLELAAGDLAFTRDEVAALVARTLGEEEQELAGALHDATGGWPAEVRLAVEALQHVPRGARREALERLQRPQGPLFQYVAEEVFDAEPAEARDLLRRIAWLDRVDPALCEALGVHGAREILAALARRGLLVQAEGEGADLYTLHALLRDFLLQRMPVPARELRRLRLRAARWFGEQGRHADALRCSVAARDRAGIVRLLSRQGAGLLAGGTVEDVVRAVELVPAPERDAHLEQIAGEAHALGDWDAALACYRRAAGEEEELSPGLAWRIGRIHFDRGEPERALQEYLRGRVDGRDPREEALLLGGVASAQLSRGHLDEAREAAAHALERAQAAGDARALAAAHNVCMVLALRTDPAHAEEHYRLGLEAAEAAGDVLQTIRIRSNHVAHLLQQGRYDESLAELEPVIRLAEVAGVPLALAFALLKRGETRFYLGELDLAIANFEAARSIYERYGSSRAFRALMEIGEVYRERGDRALARSALELAARGAEQADDVQVLAYAEANLARVLAVDDLERATLLAEKAVERGRASGHAVVFALLSRGWVLLALGERGLAAAAAAEAAAAARERGDRAGLAESLELEALSSPEPSGATRPLEEALAIWREIGSPLGEAKVALALARLARDRQRESLALGRLRGHGVRVDGASAGLLAALPPADPVPLQIRALGGFSVLREGRPMLSREWRSKKARDLLQILVARRGRLVPREVVMEALWPRGDPSRLGHRLSVALSALRGVLDPERRHHPERFVRGERQAISLDLAHVAVDLEDFLAGARTGLALRAEGRRAEARELLLAAEAAYAGDLLEDVYEEWAVPPREDARDAYLAVARALAEEAAEAGDPDAAARYLLRILERDAYDERAHLELVRVLARAGRHGSARRQYGTYVARMEEIGVEPSPFPAAHA
ncbi:MAG TPA: BTAD domain-containing putative transcriptional regulator [Gaiellaceae bacterium]|nr:BTAD domain-containing putative transcriptional regulator [Gaiellaceae bacterium]